ncbi:MAG: T9SS type A sorting domain-containing protein [Chitinophagaceae bacterium]|nr:T9SS type A sorting domain-containing protein [Chitinophagaceae bacterium]
MDVSGTTLIVEEDDFNAQQAFTIMNNTGGNFVGNFATVVIPLGYTITYNPAGSATVVVTKLGSTLPAVWGDFNALAKNNNRVNLNWSTLQENNVSHYTVEYSANGRDYTSIGTVAAAGNTTNVTNYSFVHNTPDVQKTNYYRIRQSDLDGKTAYSVIRPVRFSKGTVAPILVTPNPVRDRLQLSVQAENIRIMLVDLSGRTLKNMNLQPGNHELSVTELAPGMYHLVIFQDGLRLETQKLIKQ